MSLDEQKLSNIILGEVHQNIMIVENEINFSGNRTSGGGFYQNVDASELSAGVNPKTDRPIIWQIFRPELTRYRFPYPPVYSQEDADYICFTDQKDVHSKFWHVEYREEICPEKIREELSVFPIVRELQTNEIQIGSLFQAGHTSGSVIDVPPFGELPLITFDPERFVATIDEQGNYIHEKNPVYQGGKYDGREYLLTLGMPVSNQIGTIDRCLSHVKPLLDELDAELLIVDTGSTDGTLDVCRSYGARIVEFPWCDNMSAARNKGFIMQKARGTCRLMAMSGLRMWMIFWIFFSPIITKIMI